MKLLELFNRTAPWEWADDNMFGHTDVEAHFEIDGVQYVAGFADMFGSHIFGFVSNSGNGWQENDTGGGNELMVFSTIMDIISNFVTQYHPDELAVGGVPSRERIYTRMLKRKESEIQAAGYELTGPEQTTWPGYGNVVMYTIRKEMA